MIRILNILPVIPSKEYMPSIVYREKLSTKISDKFGGNVTIDTRPIEKGVPSIESTFDEAVNLPGILKQGEIAKKENYDAVTIDCFADPGMDALRELLDIPVVGPFQATTHLAVQLGERFSIINTLPSLEHVFISLSKKYGVLDSLASIRTVNIPVLGLNTLKNDVIQKISQEIKNAIFKDDADVIVLGCTGMSILTDGIRSELIDSEVIKLGIPILDPLKVALYTAINLCMLDVRHNKKRYNLPKKQEGIIYDR